MSEEVVMVNIGGTNVGIVGLKDIFEEIKEQSVDDEILKEVLLAKVKEKNYIVKGDEEAYKQALFEEYKILTGELKKRTVKGPLEIRVLGPGCPNCKKLGEEVIGALSDLGVSVDFDYVKDPVKISEYGIIATPALVVNGRIKSYGRVLSRGEIVKLLEEER